LLELPRHHLASALREFFLADRMSTVVAGTHGKTTCASLIAFLLQCCGADPGFLVGGVPRDLGSNYRLGRGPFFVVEGDEYDCAWFDKRPKFIHYAPRHLLVTNIEFDHADIYRDMAEVRAAFRSLVSLVPKEGTIVYCNESSVLREVIEAACCRTESYALSGEATWTVRVTEKTKDTRFELLHSGVIVGEFRLTLPGKHNLLNAAGCLALWNHMGLSLKDAEQCLDSFSGAARRMEILTEGTAVLVDDFAHHPTEIYATLLAARERWPGRRLWALFEPKTQTNRRSVLQDELADALGLASRVLLLEPTGFAGISPDEQIDTARVVARLAEKGISARWFATGSDMAAFLLSELYGQEEIIIMMTAGSFDGVRGTLQQALVEHGYARPV
jgi:UDP-N-acetylmuramate: L-alanyl-gamma-D-glutamyl-meso-diaminopimelate ligase